MAQKHPHNYVVALKRGRDAASFDPGPDAEVVRTWENIPRSLELGTAMDEDAFAQWANDRGDVLAWEPRERPVVFGALSRELDFFSDADKRSTAEDNWGVKRVLSLAWPFGAGEAQTLSVAQARDGNGVDLYNVDSGIDVDHDEWFDHARNRDHGEQRAELVADPLNVGDDDQNHGTHTASSGGGSRAGLAPGARVFGVKVLNSANTGTASDFNDGVSNLVSHYNGRSALGRPAVVNMSLIFGSDVISAAIDSMRNAGLVMCAASGNDLTDLDSTGAFPAEDTDTIAIGGVMHGDNWYAFDGFGANFGSQVDVASPSLFVNAGIRGNMRGNLSGTSMGCGISSGAVACMLQGFARLTSASQVDEVKAYAVANANAGRIPQLPSVDTPNLILYVDPDLIAGEDAPATVNRLLSPEKSDVVPAAESESELGTAAEVGPGLRRAVRELIRTASLTVTNGDAETGDTTGWTQTEGAGGAFVATGAPNLGGTNNPGSDTPWEGSFCLSMAGVAASAVRAHTDVSVAAGDEADVDAGAAEVEVTWAQASFNGIDDDQGQVELIFLDGGSSQIGSTFQSGLRSPARWTPQRTRTAVPPLTRTIRLQLHGNRRAGTALNAYFDSVAATLHVYNPEEYRGGESESELAAASIASPRPGVAGEGSVNVIGGA